MRFSTALGLFTLATLALAQDAVVSMGVFHGFDFSDPKATPLQVFQQRRNHLIAVASVLHTQGTLAHYTPYKQEPSKSSHGFKTFEEGLGNSPLWQRSQLLALWPAIKQGGRDDLQQAIEKALDDHPSRSLIAKHLTEMVPTTVENPKWKRWALSIVAVKKGMYPEDEIQIGFAKLLLDLEVVVDDDDDGGGDGTSGSSSRGRGKGNNKQSFKVKVPRQVADLDIMEFRVDHQAFVDHAETLAKKIIPVSLDEYMDFFTTPKAAYQGHLSWNQETGEQVIFD